MDANSRLLLVALLGLLVCGSQLDAEPAHPQHADNAIPRHDSDHKLLHECQNSDYRTYIRCLKREKRQHFNSIANKTRSCLDECFEQNCTTSLCLRDCHTHCRKRLIETYTKTVETSFDCNNGECLENDGHNKHTPNVTTNIHIENVLPNKTRQNTDDSNESQGVHISNVIYNQYGSGSNPTNSNCPCPSTGCNCNSYPPYNPWQSLPQITIGFGPGPIGPYGGGGGGCVFPSWPCYQKFQQPPSADCSMCNNPFLRYRCDTTCYDPSRNYTQSIPPRPPAPNQPRTGNTG